MILQIKFIEENKMGIFQHRGMTKLAESEKPKSVSVFRGSNKEITQEDIELFNSARNDQVDKNVSGAKSKYSILQKKSYLKNNIVIQFNLKLIASKNVA